MKKHILHPLVVKGKMKYFCIGQNKTGTTSLKKSFEDLGFIVGDQRAGESLLPYYRNGNWEKIISYCRTAQVFQDFPFSYPETFKHTDAAFPGSKFILSIRDNPEQWYNSMVRFHSKLWGLGGRIPTKEDLQEAVYLWKGRPWEARKLRYQVPDDDPYNKEIMINAYNEYNNEVIEYFRERPGDLLIINVSQGGEYKRFCNFLGVHSPNTSFPWENKTADISIRRPREPAVRQEHDHPSQQGMGAVTHTGSPRT